MCPQVPLRRVRVSGCLSPPWHQLGSCTSPVLLLQQHPELGSSLWEPVGRWRGASQRRPVGQSVLGSSAEPGAGFQPHCICPTQSRSKQPQGLEQPADAVRSCLASAKLSWPVLGVLPWRGAIVGKMGFCFFLPRGSTGAVGPALWFARRCCALAAPAARDPFFSSSLCKHRLGGGS